MSSKGTRDRDMDRLGPPALLKKRIISSDCRLKTNEGAEPQE